MARSESSDQEVPKSEKFSYNVYLICFWFEYWVVFNFKLINIVCSYLSVLSLPSDEVGNVNEISSETPKALDGASVGCGSVGCRSVCCTRSIVVSNNLKHFISW